ncbi:MAG: hypothetical protein U5P10_07470 [Spirochaetia bacterium]|nr:hypothetical protein [Spirochaetia bacterium]
MSSLRGGPFRFGELKGTRWYHRFVAEEFYLVFDQLPKKSIVIDRCIDRSVDRRVGINEPTIVEEYRRQLLDFFLRSPDIDTFTPARILRDLRRLRKTALGKGVPEPPFHSFNTTQAAEGYVQKDRLNNGHSSIQSKLQALYPGNTVCVMPGFTEALQRANRILFIPGSSHRFAGELYMLLQQSAAEIEIACTIDDTEVGVTAKQVEQFLSARSWGSREIYITEALPFVLEENDINDLVEKGADQLICISNIWIYLQVFRCVGGFCFFIDNSEWFSRGLFQSAYDTAVPTQASPLYESSYKEMLQPTEPKSGHTVAAFQEHPFPSQVDVSGVQYNSLSLYRFLKGDPVENLSDRLQRQQKQLQDIGWHQVVNSYVSLNEGMVQPSVAGADGAILS